MPELLEQIKRFKRSSGASTDLDQIFDDLIKEEKERLALAKIREYRLETEKRLRELESSMPSSHDGGESEKITPEDIEVAKQLSQLPDEERNKVIAVLRALKGSGGKGITADYGVLIPLVLATTRTNPNASVSEITSAVKDLFEVMTKQLTGKNTSAVDPWVPVIEKIIDRALASKTSPSELPEPVKKVLDRAIDLAFTPSKSWLESILEDEDKLALIQRLTGKSEETVELLKLRKELLETSKRWEALIKTLDFDQKLKLLQLQSEAQRSRAIETAVRELLGALGEALTETPPPQTPQVQRQFQQVPIENVQCPQCKYIFPVEVTVNRVVCPNCGAMLERPPEQPEQPEQPPEEEEEETKPKTVNV